MAIPHRRTDSYWQPRTLGTVVVPVLYGGLSHPDAAVREGCVQLLDRFLTGTSSLSITAVLDDAEPYLGMQPLEKGHLSIG